MTSENDSIDLVDRLVGEYADRLARDEDPCREELLAQAPQFRAELERCFRMLDGERAGPQPLATGYELGDFRLGRVLGRGGMAVVYEAEQKSLKRRVALKVLRHHLTLDAKPFERFQREARAAAKLQHENVVPIHAVGEAQGHAFIAFELVQGPTLARVVDGLVALRARPTARDLARISGCAALASLESYSEACVRLLKGVFEAVEFAHRQGVIHRDLKPSNVLLTGAGKPLVADFGLAKDMGETSLSITGETIGTPHYMSPEQAQALTRGVDARSDVYSLGVTLYELLTLRRPFEGDTLQELLQSIVTSAPRSPCGLAPDVPEKLGDVVLKALAKDPAARYASVGEFSADLEQGLRGGEIRAQSSTGLAALFGGLFEAQLRGAPFEYRSKRSLFGLPWIHVATGIRDPKTRRLKWAKGVIAAGDQALGFYAAGKFAVGLLAFGLVAIGPLALGLVSAGYEVMGGLAVGWRATGAMVAGRSGRGLLDEWLAKPLATALDSGLKDVRMRDTSSTVTLVGIVLSITMIYGLWSRLWPGAEPFLRRLTRFWMPLFYLIPFALHCGGIDLPFMANVLLLAGITLFFSLLVKHKLGKPRSASGGNV